MSPRVYDSRQVEMFSGPEVAGKRYAPNHANWLRASLPKVLKFLSDVEASGEEEPKPKVRPSAKAAALFQKTDDED